MWQRLKKFIRGNDGQDLIEYTLLLAFVCLLCAGIMMGTGTSISGIWDSSNATIAAANSSISGSSSAPAQSTGGGHGDHGDHDGHHDDH